MIRATLIGGIFFLIPVAFLLLVLGKAWEVSHDVVAPVAEALPLERVGGVGVASLLALGLLVGLCLLAGMAARMRAVARRMERLDALVGELVPSYAIAKTTLSGLTSTDVAGALKPVLVRFDDYEAIAFEVERDAARVVVYLPGAPSAWSGTIVLVDPARVAALDLPGHRVTALMRSLGRGGAAIRGRVAPGSGS